MIPLTLRAMFWIDQPRVRRSARPAFALPLVLALLAMACFPVISQADSIGTQYETAVPTVEGHKSSPTHSSNPSAETSNKSGSATSPSDSEEAESEGSGAGSSGGSSSGGGGATAGDGRGSQPSQASAGNGKPQSGGSGSVTKSEALPLKNSSDESSDSGGGSSPLVPILIVVALLAAISIGAVVYRQRRQGPGSTVSSPKAS
jgi:cobalamin biosynthesis Mg chelatase CobN